MKKPKIKIFIAAPYTLPDPCVNTHRVMSVANNLLNLGYAPFIPHLNHFQHIYHPRPYEDWMDLDAEFLKICDVVWRLPGKSNGADKEVELAKELNIPVVYNIESLRKLKINNE